MNKVFKVIWSEARNAYVVVSEIAKNHGSKSCSTKKLLTMLIATGVMTCASMAPAMAGNPAPDDANKGWTLSIEGKVATEIAPGATVDFSGKKDASDKQNIIVRNDGNNVKIELQSELNNVSAIVNGTSRVTLAPSIAGITNGQAQLAIIGDSITLRKGEQGSVQIHGVAAGTADTDAVNVAQLKKVNEEALKHSTVTNGDNITVTEGLNKDGGKEYNVALNNDIHLFGDNGAMVNISGSHGTIWTSGSVTAGSVVAGDVVMDSTTATVSGLGNKTTAYEGFATTGKAATEEQLKEVATEAGKHTTLVAGDNVKVKEEKTDNGLKYTVSATDTTYTAGNGIAINGENNAISVNLKEGEVNLAVDEKGLSLNKDLKGIESISNNTSKLVLREGWAGMQNGVGASVFMVGGLTTINDKVTVDEQGKISGVAAGTADTDAVNYGQLKDVKTEAGKHTTLSDGKNTTVESTVKDGQTDYKVNVAGDLTDITSVANGDAKLALNGAAGTAGIVNGKGASIFMMNDNTVINNVVGIDKNGKISGVAAGAVTADSTDAVNGSQLHAVATEAGKHSKVVNGSNINVEEFDNDGQKIYKVNLNKDIMLGDLTGKYVSISGTNGTIETTGYIATKDRVYADKGGKLADIDVTGNKISNGASSIVLDGSNVKVNDKVTIDQNGKISGVAAGEISSTSTDAINGSQLHQTNENVAQNKADIAQNKADIAQNKADIAANRADIDKNKADIAQNKTDIKNLDNRVTNVEELAKKHSTVTAGDNITVTEDKNKDGGKEYKVALDKDINLDSVTTGQTVMNKDGLKIGKDVSVTATAVTAGKTSISDEGVKVGDKTYISDKGLNANDQKVTNVAAGELSETSKDAVNGSQLYKTNQEVVNNTNRINKLGSRVNKVGAGAAALAALHPMDFDPDDKLTFSAGYGNYAGENAAAIGAYYRPDEKVMFSVAGTVGNGENMVNAGVSFALDRTNHVSNSRTALAREVIDLRGQLAVMGAKMAKMEKAFGMLDETKTKLFPDVPANHWAYEYIAKLAGNGYIEGYPDGNFGGDRLMTRYEFAAMLYRAIENGAALEEKIIKEFEPELGRIRVDRISGEDGDRDKIERVRVNDTKGERDHYGNKLAK